MITIHLKLLINFLVLCFISTSLMAEQDKGELHIAESASSEECYSLNFPNVPAHEFIRFVSRVSNVNFIYDNKDLQFNITLSSGKPVSAPNILKALIQMLRSRGLHVMEQNGYYVIHRSDAQPHQGDHTAPTSGAVMASNANHHHFPSEMEPREFLIHKLQYQQGSEVEVALRKIATDLQSQPNAPIRLLRAIQSLQWVKATNTLLASADETSLAALKKLIQGLDVPLKQVFIEVLVIETDVRNSMDFGLEWAAGGKYHDLGFGVSNFAPRSHSPFAGALQGTNASSRPTGLGQIPVGNGFNLGIIGDLILHKGKSYFTLGSLVSALQMDGNSTIVLNQKIITQDNKNSKIFVGDNIPFAGSVVQTIGASQQTTSNIDYRDVGVSLSITPTLGEGDVITLDIKQEITEALGEIENLAVTDVAGIRTTKTDMSTQVHVPDQHFLILTGMIRNHKFHHKAGLPCLGGLPVIGAAFSKNKRRDDRKNVIIYVRPQIIHSVDDYKKITHHQEELFRQASPPADFDSGLDLIVPPPSENAQ